MTKHDIQQMLSIALAFPHYSGILMQAANEIERLREMVNDVANAFEPGMDDQLAIDERRAVARCRDDMKEISEETK